MTTPESSPSLSQIDDLLARPFATISALIGLQAQIQPTHAALIQDDRRIDYATLNLDMDRVASALQHASLGPQDRIAICATTSIEYTLVFLGALRAGVAVVPLAPGSSAESLSVMLQDSGAKLLFLDRHVASALAPLRSQLTAAWIGLDFESQAKSSPTPSFRTWLSTSNEKAPAPVVLAPDDPFNIIYSSGTTGLPKGIVQPHSMRWGHVRRGRDSGYGPQAVTLISTPLYSNTTLVSFFPSIALGGAVVLMAKFDAERFLTLAEREHVTHAMLVPVQYQRVLDHPTFARFDLSHFVVKFCTSAPFSAELKQRVLTHWPGALVEYYGMTEGGGTCVLIANAHPDKLHTVGKPAPGHDIRVIDEHGRELPAGEAGEVVGSSPVVMTGYHNQPQKTSDAEWYDSTGKRFIRTGDVGRFDSDGFLTLLDRKKDMIISGGFNVYPSDLEAVLQTHDAVVEVAVVGVPSERWGETPVAFVVCKADRTVSAKELTSYVNERVGKTQRVTDLEIVETLPRSSIGKVLKRQLRSEYVGRGGTPSQKPEPAPAQQKTLG